MWSRRQIESMNLVQRLTDFEFKFADTFRSFVPEYSTIMFARGAISVWRRDRFSQIYENHPGLPIGEDGWAGRLNLKAGWSMKQDSGPLITTESSPTLIPEEWWAAMTRCCPKPKMTSEDGEKKPVVVAGYGTPNLFNQRACRWELNAPRHITCHIKLNCS